MQILIDWKYLIIALFVTQLLILNLMNRIPEEKLSSRHSFVTQVIVLQTNFNPPKKDKPKGSSGAGSRRFTIEKSQKENI
ncbi:MAG: hypothetical protein IGS39_03600 [Calothrix sp. C42_A2020_038]|nr:hypothetical protein [Calothrix sp. C42_A2020_038]